MQVCSIIDMGSGIDDWRSEAGNMQDAGMFGEWWVSERSIDPAEWGDEWMPRWNSPSEFHGVKMDRMFE